MTSLARVSPTDIARLTSRLQQLDVLATGGTIDMRGADARRPDGATDRLRSALDAFTPSVAIHRPIPAIDSSNMGPPEWARITAAISGIVAEKRAAMQELQQAGLHSTTAGIVLTHGTDTLQETALVLALEASLLNLPFPILLTCAYVPPDQPGSDATSNFVLASLLAQQRTKTTLQPGVYVVVADHVHLAARIKKVTTVPVGHRSYVESIDAPIGYVIVAHCANLDRLHPDHVTLRVQPLPKPSTERFSYTRIRDYGNVEHLWFPATTPVSVLQDAAVRMIDTTTPRVRAALVLHGDFSSKPPAELRLIGTTLARLQKYGIATFTSAPRVDGALTSACDKSHLVSPIPRSLTPAKARTKLSWLLQFDIPQRRLAHYVARDFAGECFQLDQLPDWIVGERYGEHTPQRRVVVAYPGIRTPVIADTLQDLCSLRGKRSCVVIGFGDGNLPLGDTTVAEATASYVSGTVKLTPAWSSAANYREVTKTLADQIAKHADVRRDLLAHYRLVDDHAAAHDMLDLLHDVHERDRDHWTAAAVAQLAQHAGRTVAETRALLVDVMRDIARLYRAPTPLFNLDRLVQALESQGIAARWPQLTADCTYDQASHRIIQVLTEWLKHETSLPIFVAQFPHTLARRVMKDALAIAHPMLAAILRATDDRVRVVVRTNAEMSRTDTRKYELGNCLLVVGADSDDARGWPPGPFRHV